MIVTNNKPRPKPHLRQEARFITGIKPWSPEATVEVYGLDNKPVEIKWESIRKLAISYLKNKTPKLRGSLIKGTKRRKT